MCVRVFLLPFGLIRCCVFLWNVWSLHAAKPQNDFWIEYNGDERERGRARERTGEWVCCDFLIVWKMWNGNDAIAMALHDSTLSRGRRFGPFCSIHNALTVTATATKMYLDVQRSAHTHSHFIYLTLFFFSFAFISFFSLPISSVVHFLSCICFSFFFPFERKQPTYCKYTK